MEVLFFQMEILFFRRQFVKPTISQELAVFPKFAPKIIPMPAPKEISPALKKEIVTIETKIENCIIKVLKVPKSILFIFVSVDFTKIFSSKSPLKTLKPIPKLVIPIRSIATPAKRLASSS